MGENLQIMDGCIIDPSHCWHIKIGDNVTLAPRVHILAHDASTKMFLGYTKVANVNIGSNVFIGAGSIILPGVTIGSNSIIGAGSIVTKSIPESSVAAGNPAKIIMSLEVYLNKEKDNLTNERCFDKFCTLRYSINSKVKDSLYIAADTYGTIYVE